MRIKLATPLIGEFPRYANVKLPDNAAAPVSSRSSVTVQRQSNGAHPDTSGYQQIGDALWAFLKCNV